MLLEKYEPKSTKELIGNRLAAIALANFLKSWKKGKAAMLCGESGIGKTLVARLVSKELRYQAIEVGADDDRNQKGMSDLLRSSGQAGLFGSKKLFIIDELEQLESVKAVSELISQSEFPVILIVSDPYEKKFYQLRSKNMLIRFNKIRSDSIAKFLAGVCQKEGMDVGQHLIEQISKTCAGDVRAALIDLECLLAGKKEMQALGFRDEARSIFDSLRIIFKTDSIDNAMIAMNSSGDPDTLHRWIAENLPQEYAEPQDLAAAYDSLSKADIFYSRIIRRQAWSLQKYFFELSAAGVALAKKAPSQRFVKYSRPRFRRKDASMALALSQKLHVSSRKAIAYRPLIKKCASKKMLAEMGLSKEDVKAM